MNDMSVFPLQEAGFEQGMYRAGVLTGRSLTRDSILRFQENMDRVRRGRLDPKIMLHRMAEAQTLGDFPLLMADSIDRELLAGYQEKPTNWTSYARVHTNTDFRDRKIFAVDGGEGVNDVIPELSGYPEVQIAESQKTIAVHKRGSRFAFSFEAFVNDDLGALNGTPARMGKKARRTEEHVVTYAFANPTNQAVFFTAANKNVLLTSLYSDLSDDNTPFSVEGVQDAISVLSRQVDSDGQPIDIEGATIVYPSHLEVAAEKIRNTLEIRNTDGAGTTLVQRNWIAGMFNWVPNHQLRLIDTVNGETGWYVFANPSVSRPALHVARLRGHEAPELFMKSPNAMLVGGGNVDAMMGDFDIDSVEYKVRQFIGAALGDPKCAVFSKGTGSA